MAVGAPQLEKRIEERYEEGGWKRFSLPPGPSQVREKSDLKAQWIFSLRLPNYKVGVATWERETV